MATGTPTNLPLDNLSPAQRQAFQTHLDDLWDDYQDMLADLTLENSFHFPLAALILGRNDPQNSLIAGKIAAQLIPIKSPAIAMIAVTAVHKQF